MVPPGPRGLGWEVVAGRKQSRVIAAATQRLRGDEEFDATVLLDVRQFARQFPPIRPGLGHPTLQCPEQFLPAFVVHGPAIVRVDQAEVPQLGSLVDVGHARRR